MSGEPVAPEPQKNPSTHHSPRPAALAEALGASSRRPAALLARIRAQYPAQYGLASARPAAILDAVRAAGL